MELTLERPGDHLYIRSVTAEGIHVGDRVYPGSLILSASEVLADWPVRDLGELNEERLEPLFALAPEIVLLGTGPVQVFPAAELLMHFYGRNVGVEIMTTRAACRTFNILVSERRNVVAALLPPGPDSLAQSRNGSS